MFFSTNIQ
jgi:hypothetical protein